jgi:hypothetical protein
MAQSNNRLLASLTSVLPLADRFVTVLKGSAIEPTEREDVRLYERTISTARRSADEAAQRPEDVPDVVLFMANGHIQEVRCDRAVRLTVFDFSAPAAGKLKDKVLHQLPDVGFGTSAVVTVLQPKPERKAMAHWLAQGLRHVGIK